MATDLTGKAVLITGASTGIGAAAARAFARRRRKVVVHYNASREPAAGRRRRHQGAPAARPRWSQGDVTVEARRQAHRRRAARGVRRASTC